MLKNGFAVLATAPPNVKYVEKFQRAQSFARNGKHGIWNPAEPLAQSPRDFRIGRKEVAAKQAEQESAFELSGYEPGCVIGNRKTRRYHLPTGRYYDQAKLSKNRVFFKNADDAEKAGYTRSVH